MCEVKMSTSPLKLLLLASGVLGAVPGCGAGEDRCDRIYPVLGCPCDEPENLNGVSCCVPHQADLKRWEWRYGYFCGGGDDAGSGWTWRKYDFPEFGFIVSHHPHELAECRACPRF